MHTYIITIYVYFFWAPPSSKTPTSLRVIPNISIDIRDVPGSPELVSPGDPKRFPLEIPRDP